MTSKLSSAAMGRLARCQSPSTAWDGSRVNDAFGMGRDGDDDDDDDVDTHSVLVLLTAQ